jgi:hypothetical protein
MFVRDVGVWTYARFDLPEGRDCVTITAMMTILGPGECDLYADFVMPFPNYDDGFNLPRYQSNFGGDDMLHFQYCYGEHHSSSHSIASLVVFQPSLNS